MVVIVVIKPSRNPLARMTIEEIREQLLLETPIGTHIEDVSSFVDKNEDWNLIPTMYPYRVWVHLGGYRYFVFWTDVSANWRFDEEFRLVDIVVRKSTDMP